MDWQSILEWGTPKGNFDISFGITERLENYIVDWIIQQISQITNLFFKLILDVPLRFFETNNYQQLYWLSIKIVLSIIVPIVMYHGIKLILNKITINEIGEHFLRLFISPFAIWLAPIIIRYSLMVVNKICIVLLEIPNTNVFVKPEVIGLGTILYVVIMLYYLMRLSIYYAGRNVLIIFLVVVFPLIYLLACFPTKFDKLDKYINEISSLILTQFVHVIQLLILFALTEVSGDPLLEITLRLGALWVMLNAPNWVEGYLESNINRNINFEKELRFIQKSVGYMTNPKKAIKGAFDVFKP